MTSLRLVVWPSRAYVVDSFDFFADSMALHILRELLSLLKARNFQEPSLLALFRVFLGLPALLSNHKV